MSLNLLSSLTFELKGSQLGTTPKYFVENVTSQDAFVELQPLKMFPNFSPESRFEAAQISCEEGCM